MKSHLIAEKRLDRTGKLVTRYIKADASQTPMKAISLPSLSSNSSAEQREVMIEELSILICDNEEASQMCDTDAVRKSIRTFDDDTLDCIRKYMEKNDEYIESLPNWIDVYAQVPEYLNGLLHYADSFDPATSYSYVEEVIYDLKNYDFLPQEEGQDYTKVDAETEQTIRNLLNVTETLYAERHENDPEDTVTGLPRDLARLVMERPDDVERINDILINDPETQADRIAMMLDSPSPSVADGIL